MEQLRAFSINHYNYVNQLLGDQTLRAIITEEFKSPEGWSLKVVSSGPEFEGSFHHYCGKGRSKWCSANEGIQDIYTHPNDTLCQSYSMMKYLGNMRDTDVTLTKELQERMVVMWRGILANRRVQEQIIFSVKLKTEEIPYRVLQALAKEHGVLPLNVKSTTLRTKLKQKGVVIKPKYYMQDVSPRGPGIIKSINKVLNQWAEYGWAWYMVSE